MTNRSSISRLADDAPVPHPDSWPSREPPSVDRAAADIIMTARIAALNDPYAVVRAKRGMAKSAASAAASAAFADQARRTARIAIKDRARDYLAEPWQLDMLRLGFSASGYSPEQLIEFAEEVRHQEVMSKIRFQLVPVNLINARAAIVAGRYRRAKANQTARRTA